MPTYTINTLFPVLVSSFAISIGSAFFSLHLHSTSLAYLSFHQIQDYPIRLPTANRFYQAFLDAPQPLLLSRGQPPYQYGCTDMDMAKITPRVQKIVKRIIWI